MTDKNQPIYREGFSGRAVAAAFFVGLIILPGAIYLGLVNGPVIGGMAQWVTIILFLEVAKRSLTKLSRQEVYIIYLVAGGMVAQAGFALYGGAFAFKIWDQYFIQSQAARSYGLDRAIPSWVVPSPDSYALTHRTFFHKDWLVPIALLLCLQVLNKVSLFGLGYPVFRITRERERLEFPMAPVAVGGVTALVESTGQEGWRWRVFSTGGMIGVLYGVFYTAIPVITGLFMSQPLQLIQIPFFDFTAKVGSKMPAASLGISTDLGSLLVGFVLPFWVVVGTAFGSIARNLVVNPILSARTHLLDTWKPGMSVIPTQVANSLDFWLSVSIGTGMAVGLIGLWSVGKSLLRDRQRGALSPPPAGRGDFKMSYSLAAWALSTAALVALCHHLVPTFPLWLLLCFGFVLTPALTYVSARMFGITGTPTGVSFPMVREAAFILSDYQGAAIWFAPVPYFDFGFTAQEFTQLDLLRCKFRSWVKATAAVFLLLFLCSLLFWGLLWRMGPIPSSLYPYAQKMWPYHATLRAIWVSSTVDREHSWVIQALKPSLILGGGVGGLLAYGFCLLLRVPTQVFYGMVGGIGVWPHHAIPMLVGSLLGRFYFAKKFGPVSWKRTAPILLAGYGCGLGLVGMMSASVTLIGKAVSQIVF